MVNSRRDSASLTSPCSNPFDFNEYNNSSNNSNNKTNKNRSKKNLIFFNESDNLNHGTSVKSKSSIKSVSQKPILNKSKSEIFPGEMTSSSSFASSDKKLLLLQHQQSKNSALSGDNQRSATNILRRRSVYSSPKLSMVNSDDCALPIIQKIKKIKIKTIAIKIRCY